MINLNYFILHFRKCTFYFLFKLQVLIFFNVLEVMQIIESFFLYSTVSIVLSV